MTKRVPARSDKALVHAARAYGAALREQHAASAAMHRTRSGPKLVECEGVHGAACDALDRAEHDLLVCAAVAGGWSRRAAKRLV